MRRAFLLLPLLAACAGLATPQPSEAWLTSDRLTVTLTDGQRCLGDRATATATPAGWKGKLTGCSQPLGYEVRLDAHRNLLQGLLVEAFSVIGADGGFAQGGEVLVTDAAGHVHMFISPKPYTNHS